MVAEFFSALLVISAVIAALVVPWFAARWMLRPLDQAAKGQRLPFQFTLADFLVLFFLLQVPTSALMFDRYRGWVLVAYGWIAFGMMWLVGVGTLSRAGIHNPWHRALFVALIIPCSVCAALGLPIALFIGAGLFLDRKPADAAIAAAGALAAGALAYGLGRLTRRMVAARDSSMDGMIMDGRGADPSAAPTDPFADRSPPAQP